MVPIINYKLLLAAHYLKKVGDPWTKQTANHGLLHFQYKEMIKTEGDRLL
jgi:hypothetical protein